MGLNQPFDDHPSETLANYCTAAQRGRALGTLQRLPSYIVGLSRPRQIIGGPVSRHKRLDTRSIVALFLSCCSNGHQFEVLAGRP